MKDIKELSDDQLLALRLQTKNNITAFAGKSLAQKILLNSGYGALASIYSRFYSRDIAESVTLSGQMATKWVIRSVNIFMNDVLKTIDIDYIIAADTDSIYIDMEGIVKRAGVPEEDELDMLEKFSDIIGDKIEEALQELYKQTNAFQHKLSMNVEAVGATAIWVAKKRYMMSVPSFKKVRFNPPKIKIQGIDAVRSSTPAVCRKWIKETVPLLLSGTDLQIKDVMEQYKEDFFKLGFEEVAYPRGVNGLEKYTNYSGLGSVYNKGSPIHVRAALLYNKFIKDKNLTATLPEIHSGDKIRFCYMKMPNPIRENVFAVPDELPAEFGLEQYIDHETQYNKSFFNPIKKITDAAKISLSDSIDIDQFSQRSIE